MKRILDHLARCGLLFMHGLPPKEEDGYLLVWTGACAAKVAWWDQRRPGRLVGFDLKPIKLSEVYCWMRLPHPNFWPMIDKPAELMDERAIYADPRDAFEMLTAEAHPSPHDLTSDMPIVQGDKACCNCGVLPGHRHWKDCFLGEEEKIEPSGSEARED